MRLKTWIAHSLFLTALGTALCVPAWTQAAITVVNGATFAPSIPVAQGSIATAFGAFTGIANGQASTVPWPKTINNIRVLIDNIAEAPLHFVSATQVNFQVPRGLGIGRHTIKVTGGSAEVSGVLDVLEAAPGIFVRDERQNIRRQGAVLNQNNTINSSSNRAKKGEVVQIFSTGVGPVTGNVVDGAAGSTNPLSSVSRTPQVFVSVSPATVQFAGLSTQFPGVWQVNVFVPDGPLVSGETPVVVVMDGIESNQATIWVE